MVRIRRFNIMKTSTVVALMYMVVVAIFAIPFFLFFAIAGVSTNGGPTQGANVFGGLAVAAVAVLFYGLLGWVFTAIACAIYNLVAGWVGGIEVEVDRPEPPQPPPAWLTSTTPPAPPTASPPSSPV
jgi:hypothetical protein